MRHESKDYAMRENLRHRAPRFSDMSPWIDMGAIKLLISNRQGLIYRKTMNTLANTNTAAPVSSVRDIVSMKDGEKKIRGTRYIFACSETPMELKTRLKDSGLSGGKLSKAIREVRRGNLNLAWAETQVFMEGMRRDGFVPIQAEQLKSTGVLRFEKLKEEKPAKNAPNEDQILSTAAAKLAAKLGISLEEAKGMLS